MSLDQSTVDFLINYEVDSHRYGSGSPRTHCLMEGNPNPRWVDCTMRPRWFRGRPSKLLFFFMQWPAQSHLAFIPMLPCTDCRTQSGIHCGGSNLPRFESIKRRTFSPWYCFRRESWGAWRVQTRASSIRLQYVSPFSKCDPSFLTDRDLAWQNVTLWMNRQMLAADSQDNFRLCSGIVQTIEQCTKKVFRTEFSRWMTDRLVEMPCVED
jgi:hypothetical protein